MAGTETVHVLQREIGGPVVPSAHIFTGGGKARALAEGLEQAIFVEGKIKGVVSLKLLTKRAFEQLDIAIGELAERRWGCDGAGGGECTSRPSQ